jgi:hypothetical protein
MSATRWTAYLAIALFAAAIGAAAQCVANGPGGSKVNPNRPVEADTPAANFSPVSAVNDRLPPWICFSGGYRTRLESYSGASFLPAASDSYLLTRFRLGMLLKPAPWLRVYTELQDATAFMKTPPRVPPYQETWDLRRAYLELGDLQEGHLAVRAGRQDLSIGDGQLLGVSYWRNASRGYDGVQLVSNWPGFNATVMAASQVVLFDNGLSHHAPGNNIYAADAKLSHLVPHAVFEPFALWRLTPQLKTEEGALAKLNEKTVGIHWTGTLGGHWDYTTEVARQYGHLGGDAVRSWAAMAVGGFTFHPSRFKTRVFGAYDFAYGDQNTRDGVRGTFDQLFPNLHDHLGLADQFGRQNLKALRTGARLWLRGNWIVAAAWGDYWLANSKDGFYNSAGGIVARDTAGLSGTHIAGEVDLQTSYRFDRNLEFGVGFAHVRPGEFLIKTNHPASYNYPYLMMNYNFF